MRYTMTVLLILPALVTAGLALGDTQAFDDGPEYWLREGGSVIIGKVEVKAKTAIQFSVDASRTPTLWRVDGEVVCMGKLVDKGVPDRVPFAVIRPAYGTGFRPPSALETAADWRDGGSKILLAFVQRTGGAWAVRESFPIFGVDDPAVADARTIIEFEKKDVTPDLAGALGKLLNADRTAMLREYAIRKILSLARVPAEQRIGYVKTAYDDSMAREKDSGFRAWCVGVLVDYAREGLTQLAGFAPGEKKHGSDPDPKPLGKPALDSILSILRTSKDGETIRLCFGWLDRMSWLGVMKAEERKRVGDCLRAMPKTMDLVTPWPEINGEWYARKLGELLKTYGGG